MPTRARYTVDQKLEIARKVRLIRKENPNKTYKEISKELDVGLSSMQAYLRVLDTVEGATTKNLRALKPPKKHYENHTFIVPDDPISLVESEKKPTDNQVAVLYGTPEGVTEALKKLMGK